MSTKSRRRSHLTPMPGRRATSWNPTVAWKRIERSLLLAAAAVEGIDGERAVATVNAVFAYVLVRAQLRDAARYPHVRAMRPEFTTRRTEKHFVYGLTALLAGVTN